MNKKKEPDESLAPFSCGDYFLGFANDEVEESVHNRKHERKQNRNPESINGEVRNEQICKHHQKRIYHEREQSEREYGHWEREYGDDGLQEDIEDSKHHSENHCSEQSDLYSRYQVRGNEYGDNGNNPVNDGHDEWITLIKAYSHKDTPSLWANEHEGFNNSIKSLIRRIQCSVRDIL